jgi:hypothetical protein
MEVPMGTVFSVLSAVRADSDVTQMQSNRKKRRFPCIPPQGYTMKSQLWALLPPKPCQNRHTAVVTAILQWQEEKKNLDFSDQLFLLYRCVRKEIWDCRNFQMATSALSWNAVWSVTLPTMCKRPRHS